MSESRRVFDELLELLTESSDPAFRDLDSRSVIEILETMNREDAKIAVAVAAEIPQIARAVELGLGAPGAEAIELVTGDAESRAYADRLKAILALG